ncbi:MAG: hypothetical protein KIH62_001345 [Candidatus Kerfeldbacteria bacterium]|nr:hypothetical protein [Candidatus Kerfeldbacteria bacterium]
MLITMISRLVAAGDMMQRGVAVLKKKALHLAKMSLYWSGIVTLGITCSVVIFNLAGGDFVHVAHAAGWEWIGIIVGNFLYYAIIGPVGIASVLMAYIMQVVINYPYGSFWADNTAGGFVNVSGVQTGWRLVRDICNVFFSLILVIIALANVLKIEAYSWKTLMPKFILMAILINFSKTIAGVFTDLGTVAMATFGGSFADSFASGVIGAFGLPSLGDLTGATSGSTLGSGSSGSSVILAFILAAGMTQTFFALITIYTAILIFRIIMLWFLIVLSPVAYITRILPQTKKYSSQWWEMFGRYVTVGPLITFFLWLSLTLTFGNTVDASATDTTGGNPLSSGIESGVTDSRVQLQAPTSGFTATSPNVMANFMIALMMLMASLQLASKMAAEAGKITGAVEKFAWGAGSNLLKYSPLGVAGLGAMLGAKNAGFLAKTLGTSDKLKDTAVGKGLSLLGSTVLEPREFLKKTSEGFGDWRKNTVKKTDAAVADQQHHMAGGSSIISKLAGGVLGLRVTPEYIFENVLAPTLNPSKGGIARAIGNLIKGGQLEGDITNAETNYKSEKAQLQAEKANTGDDLGGGVTSTGNGEFNRYKDIEEAQHALDEYKNIAAGMDNLDAQLTSGKFDLKSQAVRVSIQDAIDQLKRQQAGFEAAGLTIDAQNAQKEAQGLERLLSGQALQDLQAERSRLAQAGQSTAAIDAQIATLTKGMLTFNQLRTFGGSGAINKQAIEQALKDRKGELDKERIAREQKLLNSTGDAGLRTLTGPAAMRALEGFTGAFNGVMTSQSAANPNMTYQERLDARQRVVSGWDDALQRAQTARALYRPPEDLHHTAHVNHEVSDAKKKIASIIDGGELRNRLAEALAKKDHYMIEALVQRITASGDLPLLLTSFMARNGHRVKDDGTPVSADAAGLEFFRKKILEELGGMSHHASMRVANDASIEAAFNKGQQAIGVAYTVDASTGQLKFIKEDSQREDWLAAEMTTRSVRNLLNFGANQWGTKVLGSDGNLKFTVNGGGMKLLKAFQGDLADKHYFAGWSADAKAALSAPEVIQQLRKEGINPNLITALEQYRRTTADAGRVRFAA